MDGVFTVLWALFSIIITVLCFIIGWRAMQALERIAGCMEAGLRILDQQASRKIPESPKTPE